MNTYENKYWLNNEYVAGVDEVGRGCIAGPLVVCSVILPLNYSNDLINDSKVLSEKKRLILFDEIIDKAISIDLEVVNEKTIDDENIYQATKNAMQRLVERSQAKYSLIDAMPLNVSKESISIIKGDAVSISIAAASIIAKVVRDEIMDNLDKIYPEYLFKNNKGYPTKAHKESLVKYGVLNFHRKSYKPVYELLEKK